MAKYRVAGTMMISVHVDVYADSPEEARKLAADKGIMSLCHQCASGHTDEWSTSGELDGDVTILEEDTLELDPADTSRRRTPR